MKVIINLGQDISNYQEDNFKLLQVIYIYFTWLNTIVVYDIQE